MSKEDQECPAPCDVEQDDVVVPSLSHLSIAEEGQAAAVADVEAVPVPLRNINQEDPNVIPLAKCQSLEQINQSRNKNKPFRFSLNMEKNESLNGEIVNSASSESKDRDKSVPSFSESFGLRLEDSCSQSKAADSGYPNSVGQDMDMDLTPEQVDEIITETESSFDGDDDSVSGDEMDGQGGPEARQPNQLELVHQAPVIRFLDNVENGDVANNNRDGEGNNMEDNRIVGDALEFVQHVIRQEEEELQNPNIAARAPHYPEVESDEDVISNTVDGSSQVRSSIGKA
ncbi:unnamed protein product [Nesidiocoris tenuis]|uniref:Uncharacterized protein n=1 Tax=Nesidiocoris tenuis TaxID=355587 RepID=A0A6H5HGT0_9HEMI|nr:unnamed protein product [Nesidiocoris tenuis]